jgi:hypothetical protein
MMDDELGGFEDEPMTGVRAQEFSGNAMVIENMDDVERKRQKRKRKRKRRLERLGKLAVCVCCVGVIVAIVLTVVLTETAIAVTTPPPPTLAPTPMPAIPTFSPTVAHPTMKVPEPTTKPPSEAVPTLAPVVTATPAPTFSFKDSFTLKPTQDTYIFTEGTNVNKAFGNEETLFVRTGFRRNDAIPDSIALLIFDLASIPGLDQLAESNNKTVKLKLYHKPLDLEDRGREPAPITVSRLPNTPLLIESVSGSTFEPKDLVDGPSKRVGTEETEITFDITDLVFNEPLEDNQLFLMLQTRNQEQETGDHFYSRESDSPPELTVSGFTPP